MSLSFRVPIELISTHYIPTDLGCQTKLDDNANVITRSIEVVHIDA
jgi:hypothetical protein